MRVYNIPLVSSSVYTKSEHAVALHTAHSSKGLEWLNVFLIDIHGGSVPKIDADASDAAVAEERRIFYVAIWCMARNS